MDRRLSCRFLLCATVLAVGCPVYGDQSHDRLNFALMDAVDRGETQAVVRLLRQGADPNVQDTRVKHIPAESIYSTREAARGHPQGLDITTNEYPLTRAIQQNKPSMVDALVAGGANVNLRSARKMTMLYEAVVIGNRQIAETLLKKGADVNAASLGNVTPLMQAAAFNRGDIGESLIKHGADVNARSNDGQSTLRIALPFRYSAGGKRFVSLLKRAGARE